MKIEKFKISTGGRVIQVNVSYEKGRDPKVIGSAKSLGKIYRQFLWQPFKNLLKFLATMGDFEITDDKKNCFGGRPPGEI